MCHGFQEITWHTTFFNDHARKMKKKNLISQRKYVSHIYGSLKDFWYITHGLLLAKLKTNVFLKQALSFVVKNRRQRVQINNKFISLKEVIAWFHKVLYMGRAFLTYLWMIYFFLVCFSTLSNHADDNNLFVTGTDIQLMNQMLLSDFRPVP